MLRPILLLAGWAGWVSCWCACAHKPPREPGDEWLKAIRFEGNQKLRDRELASGLALKRSQRSGRPPDPYLVQLDGERVRGEYLRRGFLDVDVRSRVERAGDAATVIYAIDEGDRARTQVVITGIPEDPDLPLAKVRAQLPLSDGAPFDYNVYELAKQPLITVVEDAGYAHAKLAARVDADRAQRTAFVRLDYTLGPKSTFGPVTVTGVIGPKSTFGPVTVTGPLADAIRERVQFRTGDRYSTTAITRTQRALYGLSRFSTVQVQPDKSTESPVVGVRIAVSESARRELRLGGGFGLDPTSYEARARAGYTIAGWPLPLDTATLDLRPAYAILRDTGELEPRIRARAKLERQDLLWTYAKGEVEAAYNYLAVEAYTSYGPRARLGFVTPLWTPKVQVRIGWSIERLDFRNISPLIDPMLEAELGLDRTQRVGNYEQALVLDLRDHPFRPTQGVYVELRAVEGTRFAGSAYEYLELVPELRGYLPLGPVTLAGRVRAGEFFGEVPVTARLFSGGSSRHRGFGERELSPFVTGEVDGEQRTVPYGGAALLETGLEARVPITSWRKIGIAGVGFVDGGDVTEQRAQLDPLDLHWAVGVGLRFTTIVGPVRADVAYRVNRTGADEPAPGSRWAFHLGLGEAF